MSVSKSKMLASQKTATTFGSMTSLNTAVAPQITAADAAEKERNMQQLIQKWVINDSKVRLELQREFNKWKKANESGGRSSDDDDFQLLDDNTHYRSELHHFLFWFIRTSFFERIILLTIMLNCAMLAVETSTAKGTTDIFDQLDLVFLVIYSVEFLLKVYCQPIGFWKNNYNRFDFVILLISYLQYQKAFNLHATYLRILRAMRALRALRSLSFSRSLQVIVSALRHTMSSMMSVLLLLFLLMYIFGIVGVTMFSKADPDNYGTLGRTLMTLFVFFTMDGWTNIQVKLDAKNQSSRAYTIIFICLAGMIISTLFIGMVIENLDEAQETEKEFQQVKKYVLSEGKKRYLKQNQEKDMMRALRESMGYTDSSNDLDEAVTIRRSSAQVAADLRSGEFEFTDHLSCNVLWMDTYLSNLDYYEHAAYQIQQLQFELACTLGEMIERKIHPR